MKPKHLAFTTVGMKDDIPGSFQLIEQLIDEQIKNKIPVLTFHITHRKDPHPKILEEFARFLNSENFRRKVNENKVKITALGKWYNLSSMVVDAVKRIIDETKDYDHFFVNFCVNYDGKEEIVDACKLIIKQIFANKISESNIGIETIKENIYTSYFIPPDVVVKYGLEQKQSSFLLWDSVGARLVFTGKPFFEFNLEDFNKLLE